MKIIMNKLLYIGILLIFACKTENKNTVLAKNETIITADYELSKVKDSKALLIVFPGGGSSAKETKRDFKILTAAAKNNISVLLMNYGGKLWMENEDKVELSEKIQQTISENNLKTDNIIIGGMSIGGTVAITIGDYLQKNSISIKPKGVFVVDSPIDLYALYESSEKDIKRTDFSEERLGEPRWIVSYFKEKFGEEELLSNIQKVSPFTLKTENISNIQHLKNTKLRFYTEPDTLWLQKNRQTDFESSNAYTLQKIDAVLENKNWEKAELIQTKNKGYRSDGERNPHSWSIVDIDDLITWILE
jgi:hypothetical protein